MQSVPESDWKVFKKVHPVALDRFCERVLKDVSEILANTSKTPHERYLSVYRLVRDRDKELAQVFNDYRRSTAFWQIAAMHTRGLLTDAEFMQFSAETRDSIIQTAKIFER